MGWPLLLSSEPWLVGTTKVYSGPGADIVMESVTLIESTTTASIKVSIKCSNR